MLRDTTVYDDGESFDGTLRRMRESQGISRAELGRRIYRSRSFLCEVESGKATPSRETVQCLDQALHADGALLTAWERRKPQPARPGERFGQALARWREFHGVSLRTLASRAHVAYAYISQIEKGQRQPSEQVARLLDEALEADGQLSTAFDPHLSAVQLAAFYRERADEVIARLNASAGIDEGADEGAEETQG